MDASSVTIVVVPRERFSAALDSLDCLYRNTPAPFNVIYVDGNSPGPVKRHLERESAARGFRLLRSNQYLSPNQARNIGLHATVTKYVVFVDNDVFVSPGWLELLVACADETRAWLVGPLCCMGEPLHETIHMAGGLAHVDETSGRRVLKEEHYLGKVAVADARAELRRQPTELIEFHAMLARTEALQRLGGCDPGLFSTLEHVDLCMMVREAGGQIYIEPDAVVTYVGPRNFPLSDLPYYLLRWGEDWHRASIRHFKAKWRLSYDDPFLQEHHEWLTNRRREALSHWRRRLRRVFGTAWGVRIERWLEDALTGRAASPETLEALLAS